MLTEKVIKSLYKKYSRPKGFLIKDEIDKVVEELRKNHRVEMDDEYIIFPDLGESSPVERIPIDRVCGIVEFKNVYAIVLPRSIIFFSKESNDINMHIRMPEESWLDRLKDVFSR